MTMQSRWRWVPVLASSARADALATLALVGTLTVLPALPGIDDGETVPPPSRRQMAALPPPAPSGMRASGRARPQSPRIEAEIVQGATPRIATPQIATPQIATPEAAAEIAPRETAPPETAPPDTAPPQGSAPDTVAPETAPSVSLPAVDLSDAMLDEVGRYLWSVYERSPIKFDSTGDFTWKDAAAALRMNMSLPEYVIGGMDPDLRELLYNAGRELDAAGINWTILSGFRDDYRQSLATGYKARTDNSLHGGSTATGGWSHGCAVDLIDPQHHSDALWHWLDANAFRTGLQRLLPGKDPGHVQPRGSWHELAALLRSERTEHDGADAQAPDEGASAAALAAPPSDADTPCIYLRHREDDPNVAKASDAGPHPRLADVARGKPAPKRHETVHVATRDASKEREPGHEAKPAARKAATTHPAHGEKLREPHRV